MKDSERRGKILALWLLRPSERRTETDALTLYRQLERAHPELLKRRGGDPYQSLMSDLEGYIEQSKR